jgi:hypothetical protein
MAFSGSAGSRGLPPRSAYDCGGTPTGVQGAEPLAFLRHSSALCAQNREKVTERVRIER